VGHGQLPLAHRRYLSQDDNDQQRVVLRITMTAAAVGLVWAAWKLFNLVAMHVGLRPRTTRPRYPNRRVIEICDA
jgi:hypothetical protein